MVSSAVSPLEDHRQACVDMHADQSHHRPNGLVRHDKTFMPCCTCNKQAYHHHWLPSGILHKAFLGIFKLPRFYLVSGAEQTWFSVSV